MSFKSRVEILNDEWAAEQARKQEEAAREARRQQRLERDKDKAYAYEVKAGAAKEAYVRFGAPASHDVTLYRTGTEQQVRRWAEGYRLPGKEGLVVVEVRSLKPLTRAEYQALAHYNRGMLPLVEGQR